MKLFLSSIGVFLFVITSWFISNYFFFKPEKNTHNLLKSEFQVKTCVYRDLSKIQEQPHFEMLYANILATEKNNIEKIVPQTEEVSSIMSILHRLARETRVNFHDFRVSKAVLAGPWFELPIRITVSGEFIHWAQFLEKISQENRLFVVRDFKYENQESEVYLSAYFGIWPEVHLSQHRLEKKQQCGEYVIPEHLKSMLRIPLSQDWINKRWNRDPFVVPEGVLDVSNLDLVGVVLREGAKDLALLKDHRGLEKIVQVGDDLGEGFQVHKINEDSVVLIQNGKTKMVTWSN